MRKLLKLKSSKYVKQIDRELYSKPNTHKPIHKPIHKPTHKPTHKHKHTIKQIKLTKNTISSKVVKDINGVDEGVDEVVDEDLGIGINKIHKIHNLDKNLKFGGSSLKSLKKSRRSLEANTHLLELKQKKAHKTITNIEEKIKHSAKTKAKPLPTGFFGKITRFIKRSFGYGKTQGEKDKKEKERRAQINKLLSKKYEKKLHSLDSNLSKILQQEEAQIKQTRNTSFEMLKKVRTRRAEENPQIAELNTQKAIYLEQEMKDTFAALHKAEENTHFTSITNKTNTAQIQQRMKDLKEKQDIRQKDIDAIIEQTKSSDPAIAKAAHAEFDKKTKETLNDIKKSALSASQNTAEIAKTISSDIESQVFASSVSRAALLTAIKENQDTHNKLVKNSQTGISKLTGELRGYTKYTNDEWSRGVEARVVNAETQIQIQKDKKKAANEKSTQAEIELERKLSREGQEFRAPTKAMAKLMKQISEAHANSHLANIEILRHNLELNHISNSKKVTHTHPGYSLADKKELLLKQANAKSQLETSKFALNRKAIRAGQNPDIPTAEMSNLKQIKTKAQLNYDKYTAELAKFGKFGIKSNEPLPEPNSSSSSRGLSFTRGSASASTSNMRRKKSSEESNTVNEAGYEIPIPGSSISANPKDRLLTNPLYSDGKYQTVSQNNEIYFDPTKLIQNRNQYGYTFDGTNIKDINLNQEYSNFDNLTGKLSSNPIDGSRQREFINQLYSSVNNQLNPSKKSTQPNYNQASPRQTPEEIEAMYSVLPHTNPTKANSIQASPGKKPRLNFKQPPIYNKASPGQTPEEMYRVLPHTNPTEASSIQASPDKTSVKKASLKASNSSTNRLSRLEALEASLVEPWLTNLSPSIKGVSNPIYSTVPFETPTQVAEPKNKPDKEIRANQSIMKRLSKNEPEPVTTSPVTPAPVTPVTAPVTTAPATVALAQAPVTVAPAQAPVTVAPAPPPLPSASILPKKLVATGQKTFEQQIQDQLANLKPIGNKESKKLNPEQKAFLTQVIQEKFPTGLKRNIRKVQNKLAHVDQIPSNLLPRINNWVKEGKARYLANARAPATAAPVLTNANLINEG